MSYEILEHNIEEKEIILAGISGGGNIIAKIYNSILQKFLRYKQTLLLFRWISKNLKKYR
jgi:pyrimidine operon attenuation protein/uracil phosphoribosyltransferase